MEGEISDNEIEKSLDATEDNLKDDHNEISNEETEIPDDDEVNKDDGEEINKDKEEKTEITMDEELEDPKTDEKEEIDEEINKEVETERIMEDETEDLKSDMEKNMDVLDMTEETDNEKEEETEITVENEAENVKSDKEEEMDVPDVEEETEKMMEDEHDDFKTDEKEEVDILDAEENTDRTMEERPEEDKVDEKEEMNVISADEEINKDEEKTERASDEEPEASKSIEKDETEKEATTEEKVANDNENDKDTDQVQVQKEEEGEKETDVVQIDSQIEDKISTDKETLVEKHDVATDNLEVTDLTNNVQPITAFETTHQDKSNETERDKMESKSDEELGKSSVMLEQEEMNMKVDMSDFITVHIQQEDGTVKNKIISIIKPKTKKPFLGGFRNKQTEKEFHHASTQTMPKPPPPPSVELFSRDTQTVQIRHKNIDTTNTTSTQMAGVNIHVSSVYDKLLTPGTYETSEERSQRLLNGIIIIQKYYRRWLAKNVVSERKKQRDGRLEWEKEVEEEKKKEKEERLKFEYERRIAPKTKADFDLLYNDLEKWRIEELTKINNQNISEAEKKALKAQLLDQETDLLARIDRHKIELQKDGQNKSIIRLLGKAAAPKSWKDSKGRKVEMDNSYTIRSRELLDILNSLKMQYLTVDERLDVLLTLKHTVKEHDSKLTKEIVELLDREADLIMRNVKDESLIGLRKRIVTLFIQYCKTPNYNPQISSLLRVPQDPSVLVGDVNYCQYCEKYLRSIEFSLSSKSGKLTICKSCARKDNQSRKRQDYSHYRRMLQDLMDEELEFGDQSRIVFVFKQNDIRSLLESVWDSKSILSGSTDLDELVFVRWEQSHHWSPWNTILLTRDESSAHKQVQDLKSAYSSTLINRIYQKHVIAKSMFGPLQKLVEQIPMRNVTPKLPEIKS